MALTHRFQGTWLHVSTRRLERLFDLTYLLDESDLDDVAPI